MDPNGTEICKMTCRAEFFRDTDLTENYNFHRVQRSHSGPGVYIVHCAKTNLIFKGCDNSSLLNIVLTVRIYCMRTVLGYQEFFELRNQRIRMSYLF